jgi:Outer mitochondrial membrane transport complex protein
VEMPHGLGGHAGRSRDDLEAARAAIDFIRQDTDLDKRLSGAASAECAAFNCLVETKLAEAVRYSMWCEWASLSQLPVRPRLGLLRRIFVCRTRRRCARPRHACLAT